ncbi:Calx-beta domain-containing protein [Bradyrhizobium sp. sBnM-33]|uniref:Calx-beta domain-containing protein n=1 Tax=Bradyrhizobium sp. sBnM-33 TaxID=2831780 RepID=UPI001BCE056D|nr:Calx-beta domain-containing protein [Bradyrhizobium sp. sBnM-33]WOH46946.1 Calx-beta domain-containing protein [Bradyrhizobium sp. sBnM-33]
MNYATANSTAAAGSDYVATAGTLSFADGQATQTASVTIKGDTIYEPTETFFVNLTGATNGGTIRDGQGLGTITNDDGGGAEPTVVASTNMAALGSTDPAGIAYVPGMGFFVSDSEVEESPFFRTQDLWKLQPDGTLVQSFSVLNFTNEPTGLAFDSSTGRLYISDDDQRKIVWVNPADPTVKLGQSADTRLVNIVDPEDVAVNPTNSHLFIANGTGNSSNGGPFGAAIVETNDAVTQVYSVIRLPAEIKDPEALAYDASHDVFYVGGGFSPNIWVVDRSGNILQKLDVLEGFRNTNTSAHVKDLELAPSSDPNDDPGTLNLFVADYGNSHVSDGRMLEISDPFFWNHQAPVISTNNLTTVQNLDGSMTLLGVQVTDSDALASSQTFGLTATAGAAASGTSITPPTSSGSLTGINSVLATGVTYHPGGTPLSTDMVTLSVKDNFGATDAENFVFAQAGSGPNITLQGTSGKDVILATNNQDVLTGDAAQDQFVFAPTSSGPSVQHTITDFGAGVDKIDVRQFSNISASALPTETQQGSDTLITLDSNDTLLLKNVAAISLHASDFIVT